MTKENPSMIELVFGQHYVSARGEQWELNSGGTNV